MDSHSSDNIVRLSDVRKTATDKEGMMQEIIRRVPSWAEEVRDYLLQYEFELYERKYWEAYKELYDEGWREHELERERGFDNEIVAKRVRQNLDDAFRRTVEAGEWDGVENWIWKMKKEVMQ